MKESKILKAISYILIPFLILIIGLSLFYEFGKDNLTKEVDEKEYFNSDNFLATYMYEISGAAEYLIYHNGNLVNTMDNDIKICYREDFDNLSYSNINFDGAIKENYFLIQYKDLALTNVEYTTETDTIVEIKEYIKNKEHEKYVNIINGNIESNSDILSKKAIQFFENFEHTYYSIEAGTVVKEGNNEILKTEQGDYYYNPYQYTYSEEDGIVRVEEVPEEEHSNHVMNYIEEEKVWYTTSIEDFEIYSTYKEELVKQDRNYYFRHLINDLKIFENQIIFAIPIASILLILLLIYLCVSIGHTKNKEGIELNSFDKIPIEFVLCGALLIFGLIVLLGPSLNFVDENNYAFANSLILTIYLIIYIVSAVTGVTIIKRIKAKSFIKNSLTGRFCIWCFKIFKKCWNFLKNKRIVIYKRIKKVFEETTKNWSKIFKIVIFIFSYILLCAILIWMMDFIGFVVGLLIGVVLLFFFIEDINCYEKIEKHLKEMYEGKNTEKLDESKVTKNFKEVAKYINDISKGFENAREEGIKSERLKTELITNVSHDIKTPLTSIINYVDLLKKENIENEKAKEYIDVLDNKSQRLKKLTEDLVEASKASSGNVKLNIEKLNVVELLKQSIGEFEDKFKNKELEIITDYAEDEIYINADNRYMYRIIENLFSNINKYAQEKSRVYIDIRKNETKAIINIKNISKDRLNISSDELMQRFVRGDKSRATEGSGLGLSISKSLTELQKGKFEIKIDGDLFKVELEFDIV